MLRYIGYHPQPRHCRGLGLYDQNHSIEQYAHSNNAHIIAYYTEHASSKKWHIPELARALDHAKRNHAALIIARLDRLAHNVPFLLAIVSAEVDFIACDTPQVNRSALPLLLAVAEQDARRISERTRAALARKPERMRIGAPSNLNANARKKGAASTKRNAWFAYHMLGPTIRQLRAEGKTLREIADCLNAQGHKTRRGYRWNHNQVKRVLDRYGQSTA
jgi:DNA invertase Pin-like site-specific DNA recombinase